MTDIVERYNGLISTGFDYAEKEKGCAPTSVFEIYVGHFKDIGAEIEAEITTLRKELAEARALLTVIGKTFAGMEDGDGNEAPELVLIREFTAKSMDDILAKQAARPVLRPPSKAKGEKK